MVTVGQLHGGNRSNIIPESASMTGTIRTFSEATRKQVWAAKAPGMFWFLNAPPNHAPGFMIDEKYFKTGVKALVEVSMEYMTQAARR